MSTIQPLKFSRQASQRILVGLQWEPQRLPLYLRLITPKSRHHFNLDLTCYIYNIQGDFIGIVSGEELVSRDETGAIYHSGDDMTGEYGHDDEQIAVELLKLPEEVGHIVFVATCKSAHHFDKVNNPKLRLVDSFSEEEQLSCNIGLNDEARKYDAFIFCRLFRDSESWMVEEVNDFLTLKDIDNWPVFLQQKWALA